MDNANQNYKSVAGYRRKVWGGFVDGRLVMTEIDTGWGGFGSAHSRIIAPAIFVSKPVARRQYQDVRPIEIRELEK